MPRSTGATKRYLPTTPHWKRPSRTPPRVDVGEDQGVDQHGHQHQDHHAGHPAARVADRDDLQRPTGVARRLRRPPAAAGGSVIGWTVGPVRAAQLVAPLITEVVTAPACTPHLVRILV